MNESWSLLSSLGILASGIISFLWALVRGMRAQEKRRLERTEVAETNLGLAQKDLIEVHRLEAAAWKHRYEGEHEEFKNYRISSHDRAQKTNSDLLTLASENSELKSKTDLTPIYQFHKDQVVINAKMIQTLDQILERLKK